MKTFHFLPWLGCALLTLALSACHDDDPPALMPTLPVNGGNAVKEIVHNGNLPDCCDWAFTYSSGRLVAATGTSILNGESVTSMFNLGYEPQSVSMYGQGKEAYTLTLNGDRLINRITVDNNVYEFNYWGGNLSNWRKTQVDDGFAPVPTYTSSATITYDGGDLKQIVYVENENNPLNTVTLDFTPDVRPNVNGLLPDGVTRELGCLGFEHLFYAGLMGGSTMHLVKQVDVKYGLYPERDYTIEYEYSSDRSGNITLCNYRYEGQPASVTYKY